MADFPLNGHCLEEAIVYKSPVKTASTTKEYIGISEPPFKQRYGNHNMSFRTEAHKNNSKFSKYIWELKNKSAVFQLIGKSRRALQSSNVAQGYATYAYPRNTRSWKGTLTYYWTNVQKLPINVYIRISSSCQKYHDDFNFWGFNDYVLKLLTIFADPWYLI